MQKTIIKENFFMETKTIIKNVAELVLSNGDTHETFVKRFVSVVKGLLEFIKELNDYISQSVRMDPKNPPILSLWFTLASVGISALENGMASTESLSLVLKRAIPLAESISKKDVKSFSPIAFQLFAEAPASMIQTAVDLIESGDIPQDSIDDIFEFVEVIIKISARREMTARFVNNQKEWPTTLTQDDVSDEDLIKGVKVLGGVKGM